MGENQQQPILRSINNLNQSFVKFINKTRHNVTLYWIDYQGRAVSYGILFPDTDIEINTFVTHPWIFVDMQTRERYTVCQKDVFFPEPHQRGERTNVYITLPVYTLRDLSLRTIRRRLRYADQVFQLDIPRSLQHELSMMLPKR